MKPQKLVIMGGLLLLVLFSAMYIGWSPKQSKDLTEQDVADIKAVLKELKPNQYRIILPVIRNNKQLKSETLGTLSVSQVERIASARNLKYTSTGNLQIVVEAPDGGGGGSHTPSCTPCKGKGLDVITRLEKVTKDFDKSKYIIIR